MKTVLFAILGMMSTLSEGIKLTDVSVSPAQQEVQDAIVCEDDDTRPQCIGLAQQEDQEAVVCEDDDTRP